MGVFNLSFRQPSFKLQQTKDAWTVQFECMHGVVGPRSLVEGQHVELQGIGSSGYAWNCRSRGSMHEV